MLKNTWTEAWENPDNPQPLGMPLQGLVTMDMVMRTSMYAEKSQAVAFNPVGQIVGRMNQILPARNVIDNMIDDYIEAVERMHTGLSS
jgi:NAD(P)H-dependent flavin oxidoreductase YrpB (nitropropane dioxygenase family)